MLIGSEGVSCNPLQANHPRPNSAVCETNQLCCCFSRVVIKKHDYRRRSCVFHPMNLSVGHSCVLSVVCELPVGTASPLLSFVYVVWPPIRTGDNTLPIDKR